MVQLYREIAAHRPGMITKVGLGTFVDPRLEGAKMNSVTKADYVKLIEIEGEEHLFYKSFPIDVALIRGTTADELGNLTMGDESLLLEQLPLAHAASNSGGIVIAQAAHVARAHSLHPKRVRVPGVLIDFVVVAPPERQHGNVNVNVSLFDGRAVGIGGFVNISQETTTILYCGAFTAGGLKIASGDGQLRIVTERKHRKFIDTVEQISFSGSYATKFGRRVVYVTERAVFELREEQMTPVEIAPGVDLDRDVLPQMDFAPAIVDPLSAGHACRDIPRALGQAGIPHGRQAAGRQDPDDRTTHREWRLRRPSRD